MYKALYRAYRPETFDQLLGQDHIVRILKNQIASDTVSHAYLFCGTRGTGKTTTARLLAKGLNCLCEGEKPCGSCSACEAIREGSFMDVIEMDAASNRGIEEIRELRESVNYPPMAGRKKVYIIDEVHMLTQEAFNALLKTLEEPPEYVVFILATTEAHKLPATILSRCMRLDFKRIPEKVIAEGMKDICRQMDIDVTDSALRIIAANADGSVRDGLSILEQCVTGAQGQVDVGDVLEHLGALGEDVLIEMTEHVHRGRTGDAITRLAELLEDGKDVRQLIRDWIQHYRNLMMTRFIRDPQAAIDLSVENIERIRAQSRTMEPEEITRGIMELSKTLSDVRWSAQPRILLELCIVNLASASGSSKSSMQTAPKAMESRPKKAERPKEPEQREPGVEGPEQREPDPVEPEQRQPKASEQKPVQPEEVSEPEGAGPEPEEHTDLVGLWDQIFLDGSDMKGSMYLIRSNSALTSMDEHTFTVTVSGDVNRMHTENNRKLIEELMEKRTGKRRAMNVKLKSPEDEQISIEEAAAEAAELIGVPVDIE